MKTLLALFILFSIGCSTIAPPTNPNLFIFSLGDSGSMRPALSVNDKITLDRSFPYENLKIGDIIAYYDPSWEVDYGLLHRIIAEAPNNEFIVRGDNNPRADPTNLTKDNYHGKVTIVEFD